MPTCKSNDKKEMVMTDVEKIKILESKVEQLESDVKDLTEMVRDIAEAGQRTAHVANRVRARTQRYGG